MDTTDTTPERDQVDFTEGDTFDFPYAFKYASGNPRPTTGMVLAGKIERVGSNGAPSVTCDGVITFYNRDDDAGTGRVSCVGFETLEPGSYSWAMTRTTPAAPPVPELVKTFGAGLFKIKRRLP